MVTLAEKYKDIPDCGAGSRFAPFSWPVASYNDQHATVTTTTFTTKARRHEDFSTNERGNYSDNIFVERFADADWSTPPAGTTSMVNNLYQGMTLDAVTGLYYERFRNYSTSLGTRISHDPAGYVNGADTYQFVMGNPITLVDPSGLAGFNFQPIPLLPQPPDLNLEEQASLNLINQQLQQINQLVAVLVRGHVAVGVVSGRAGCARNGCYLILCIGGAGLSYAAGGGRTPIPLAIQIPRLIRRSATGYRRKAIQPLVGRCSLFVENSP